jgi:peptidoglycan/LPS O-acetylase OafA/YrhL
MKVVYRPEIDGLRAIAVSAVILYHAQITILGQRPFKGGFIGVDIFFVISGYLITSIILKELITTGSFSFKYFYERRVRRILPALLFVMLLSFPFAWMYLLPNDLIDFSKSILYSLGFSSNFYFHYSGQIYGAVSGLLKPFLHTWSLSVEEQFYILFPIILLFTFKYIRKYLIQILIFGFITSLGLAEWTSRNYPSASFYFLHTRMWELLAGSILAYFEIKQGYRSKNKILNSIFPSIGLFLIIITIVFFKLHFPHPSLYSLPAIVGACLIIWFSNKNELITKILSTKVFVGVGLISYSLYLWHYPIFALTRYTFILGNNFILEILSIFVIFFLSIISYYLIEQPFRNKNFKFKTIIYLITILIFFLLFINLNVIQKKGYKKRFVIESNYELDNEFLRIEHFKFKKNYNYDNYDNRKNALIVGNSHGEDLLEILSKTNLKDKIYFNLASKRIREDYYNFHIYNFYEFLIREKSLIDNYKSNFDNHLRKQYDNSDLIILSSRYIGEDLKILDKLIKILKNDNKKIIVFNNALHQTMTGRFNRLDYFVYKNKRFPNKIELKNIEKNMYLDLSNTKEINEEIEFITKKNDVFFIKREKIFCNFYEKRCPSITEEGYKLYWDYSHITDKGAEFFARIIEKDELFLKYLNSTLHISSN